MATTVESGASGKEERILRAAVQVFAERGYHRATVADVAHAAGVAAGTIYLYFERKEALLGTLFQRLLGGYLEAGRPALAAAPAGYPRLKKLIELHLSFFAANRELARVVHIHLREVHPQLREWIGPTVRQYLSIIEEVLESGREASAFDPELDLRVARTIMFGALDATVTAWVLSRTPYPLEAGIRPLGEMLSRAFGVPGPSGADT